MIGRNMPFERELVEQYSLFDVPMSHHDSAFTQRLNQRISPRATANFFNGIGPSRAGRPVRFRAAVGCGHRQIYEDTVQEVAEREKRDSLLLKFKGVGKTLDGVKAWAGKRIELKSF